MNDIVMYCMVGYIIGMVFTTILISLRDGNRSYSKPKYSKLFRIGLWPIFWYWLIRDPDSLDY